MSADDRPRGILSPEDRAFLRGEAEFEHEASARNARKRIRERVRHGLADFGLLFEHMERRDRLRVVSDWLVKDRPQLAEELEDPDIGPPELEFDVVAPDAIEPALFLGGMKHAQAFIFTLLWDLLVEELRLSPEEFEAVVAEVVDEGLRDAFGKKGLVVEPDVEVDIEEVLVDIEDMKERFESGAEEVTDSEVEWLIQLREIGFVEMSEYIWETRYAEDSEDSEE